MTDLSHLALPMKRAACKVWTPRYRRKCLLVVAGSAVCLSPVAFPPAPRLAWNASPSAPVGLYLIHPRARPARGDWVLAWPPAEFREFAARRRYLPRGVPLVKRVSAISGDTVCSVAHTIVVNGQIVAEKRGRDGQGRALPTWQGCVRLRAGELLLVNSAPGSFDGRYFGTTCAQDIIGKATPILVHGESDAVRQDPRHFLSG